MRLFKRPYELLLLWKKKRAIADSIIEMSAKGSLKAGEMREIESIILRLGLSIESLSSRKRRKAYQRAFRSLTEANLVTGNGELELNKLQVFLSLPDRAVVEYKRKLVRLRQLSEVKQGKLPVIVVPSLILKKEEVVHWTELGSILEVRVVDRQYRGGSQGLSIRIAKGVWYRTGSQRGRIESTKALISVSKGTFVITNKRVIFRGALKSFECNLESVLSLNIMDDGLMFTTGRREKPYIIRFDSEENVEVVRAILMAIMDGVAA